MKVAIIHEWFAEFAGSEKVLLEILSMFPNADIFCLVNHMEKSDADRFSTHKINTSFLQKLPLSKKLFRSLLPLMPLAVEQHDLTEYDVIISNSHAVAKGVITGSEQLHICYCYTPIRYAWEFQHQYIRNSKFSNGVQSWMLRYVLHRMRIWDLRTSNGVDHFIACSHYISRRVWRTYRRKAEVIYPIVDVKKFKIGSLPREEFYLTSSRLTPYKKVEIIVEAFTNMPDRRLVVVGAGPLMKKIRQIATPNVIVAGFQPDDVLISYMQRAKAFIFASEEDFGISPLEAQACGTPVLAFGKGGSSETVVDELTGLHFWEQSAQAICDVVKRFEGRTTSFSSDQIRSHAEKFSSSNFIQQFKKSFELQWQQHQERNRIPSNNIEAS